MLASICPGQFAAARNISVGGVHLLQGRTTGLQNFDSVQTDTVIGFADAIAEFRNGAGQRRNIGESIALNE